MYGSSSGKSGSGRPSKCGSVPNANKRSRKATCVPRTSRGAGRVSNVMYQRSA